ncbi:MAG: type II toxin-antitoxin system VapC family toxin [Cytophagaceae bacterium]|nr:MAG: type II toxin-antitoxin system VapC family toxin [Cytophagaceae bacterium]
MGKKYLIDTNLISKALRNLFPNPGLSFVENQFNSRLQISVITRIELLGWKPDDPGFEADLRLLVDQAIEYPLTDEIVDQTIALRKSVKIRLPDAIIAATALVHKLTLVSDNDVDFLRVPKLKYINPARIR